MRDQSFHDYVVYDVLGGVPGITSKAMFGGWGVYKDGMIVAIIVESELYAKVNVTTKPEFERLGSHPFTYVKKDGKQVTMSYWLVPEELLENREKLFDLINV